MNKFIFYCNNCGLKLERSLYDLCGKDFKVCNKECLDKLYLRYYETLLQKDKK